jgi:hypothetical protein
MRITAEDIEAFYEEVEDLQSRWEDFFLEQTQLRYRFQCVLKKDVGDVDEIISAIFLDRFFLRDGDFRMTIENVTVEERIINVDAVFVTDFEPIAEDVDHELSQKPVDIEMLEDRLEVACEVMEDISKLLTRYEGRSLSEAVDKMARSDYLLDINGEDVMMEVIGVQ